MTTKPLVSIIVPFFNAAPFFTEAIESVRAQTYDGWELLLVDDSSSDGSTEIAQRYAGRYPEKIRYLAHEGRQNRGKSTTRNLGLRQARGDYITFLDADDLFLSDKLARQVGLLNAQPTAGMVYGRTEYWFRWPGGPSGASSNYLSRLGVAAHQLYTPPALLTRYLRDSGAVPCICSLLARRAVVAQVGMFDERIQHLYEDQVLLAKLCLATPVYVEEGVGERYRQHPNSSSSLARQEGEYHPWLPDPARLRYLQWLEGYLDDQNLSDEALEKALRKAFQPYRHPTWYRFSLTLRYLYAQAGAAFGAFVARMHSHPHPSQEGKA